MAEIPTTDERPAPSVWAAGDVAHSWDELTDEKAQGTTGAPANGQQDQIIAERDAKIAQLEAELAAANEPQAVPAEQENALAPSGAVPGV